jgi:hypothetical protein
MNDNHYHPHAGIRRRYRAAQQLKPMRCRCRDPLFCRCWPEAFHGERLSEPPSEVMVDAGADAARHLLEVGHTPILKQNTLRALWRRGGSDRRLAQTLYDLAGD